MYMYSQVLVFLYVYLAFVLLLKFWVFMYLLFLILIWLGFVKPFNSSLWLRPSLGPIHTLVERVG